MRTKALVLGVKPVVGYAGPWVKISEVDYWSARPVCYPNVELHDEIELEVMTRNGHFLQVPIMHDEDISGAAVRALFLKEIEGVSSVSIILEAES